MKKNEVEIGKTYRVKVSGNIADVRITGENSHGGWDGVNVGTNRKVRIKSAQRLRGLANRPVPGKRSKIVSLTEYEKGITKTVEAVETGDLTKGVTVPTGAKKPKKATKDAKATSKRDPGERGAKVAKQTGGPRKTSGLDAAAHVLADMNEAVDCKTIVNHMLAQGYWRTNGKTPAATIYAAMTRDIAARGTDSRFRKVARGKFELAK